VPAQTNADAYGVTSMVAPLRRVLVRRPATSGDWAGLMEQVATELEGLSRERRSAA